MSPRKPALVVRLPNWVGDVVMTLPALHALQINGIALHCVGKPWVQDLYSGMPFSFVDRLDTMPIKPCLLLTNSLSSAIKAKCAGKKSVGYRNEGRSIFLHRSLKKQSGRHEVDTFYQLALHAASTWWPESALPAVPPDVRLSIAPAASQAAQRMLEQHKTQAPYWVLCPGAMGKGARGESKVWPHWVALCKTLRAQGKTLIACPGPGEHALFTAQLPGVTLLDGLKLDALSAVLAGAEQVMANDTGPMHLAAAVGVPTLGIFGVSDPVRTRPWQGAYIGGLAGWPSVEAVLARVLLPS